MFLSLSFDIGPVHKDEIYQFSVRWIQFVMNPQDKKLLNLTYVQWLS